MPAKCGDQGPMVCLSGSSCNETTGTCTGCPAGFRNDEVMFLGNINCGMNDVAVITVYFIASIFGLTISLLTMRGAIKRKWSKIRVLLLLIAWWSAVIPLYLLAHYLEGFRHGPAATVLFLVVLVSVNLQVALNSYIIRSFLVLILNTGTREQVLRQTIRWNSIWLGAKAICGTIMIVGASEDNPALFNGGMIALAFSLYVEVLANVYTEFRAQHRLITNVQHLHDNIQTNKTTSIVMEFANQIKKSRWVGPIYGVIIMATGFLLLSLYLAFDSSVPYSYVFWSILILTWPMLGVGPLILLRTKLGKRLGHGDSRSNTTNEVSPATRSPTTYTRHRRTSEKEEDSVMVTFAAT